MSYTIDQKLHDFFAQCLGNTTQTVAPGKGSLEVEGRRGILHSACNIDILNKRAASPKVKLAQRKEKPIENASATKTSQDRADGFPPIFVGRTDKRDLKD